MLLPQSISVIFAKFCDFSTELILHDWAIDAEPNAEWIDNAVPTEAVSTLHVTLE